MKGTSLIISNLLPWKELLRRKINMLKWKVFRKQQKTLGNGMLLRSNDGIMKIQVFSNIREHLFAHFRKIRRFFPLLEFQINWRDDINIDYDFVWSLLLITLWIRPWCCMSALYMIHVGLLTCVTSGWGGWGGDYCDNFRLSMKASWLHEFLVLLHFLIVIWPNPRHLYFYKMKFSEVKS